MISVTIVVFCFFIRLVTKKTRKNFWFNTDFSWTHGWSVCVIVQNVVLKQLRLRVGVAIDWLRPGKPLPGWCNLCVSRGGPLWSTSCPQGWLIHLLGILVGGRGGIRGPTWRWEWLDEQRRKMCQTICHYPVYSLNQQTRRAVRACSIAMSAQRSVIPGSMFFYFLLPKSASQCHTLSLVSSS